MKRETGSMGERERQEPTDGPSLPVGDTGRTSRQDSGRSRLADSANRALARVGDWIRGANSRMGGFRRPRSLPQDGARDHRQSRSTLASPSSVAGAAVLSSAPTPDLSGEGVW